MDVSNLFFPYATVKGGLAWEYIQTSIPRIVETGRALLDYMMVTERKSRRQILLSKEFWKQLIPMKYVRSRWKELTWTDLRDYFHPKDYYTAGYYLSPAAGSSGDTVAYMNETAEMLSQDLDAWKDEYEDGLLINEERGYTADHARLYIRAAGSGEKPASDRIFGFSEAAILIWIVMFILVWFGTMTRMII